VEVYRLADVVNMLVERQLTVNDHTQTLNTVGCLDVNSSVIDGLVHVFIAVAVVVMVCGRHGNIGPKAL